MHGDGFFYQAFIYLSAAVIAVPIAKRLGLGSVLGYLIAGIVIGPFVMGLVGEEGQDVMHFAEFGVVMMLFLIGLELQPALLWRMRSSILGLGGLQVLVTTLLVSIITLLFTSLAWKIALAIGLTLALSSTAIVLQTLNEKGLLKTEGGKNAFSVLLFQDIAVIPILAILPLLAMGDATSSDQHLWIDHFSIGVKTLIIIGIISGIIAAGRYLVSPIFRLIAKTQLRELFTAAALLLVISIALLMTQIGLSPALGTFLAGVVLAQSEYRHELETDVEPFKGLLLGLFFIAVGASIDFDLIFRNPELIALLVLGLMFVKFVVLFVLARIFGMQRDSSFMFTFSLAQGGEFAFVLFSFALQNNVMGHEVTDPLIAAVVVSMALTPLLMLINEKVIRPRLDKKDATQAEADTIEDQQDVIIAGFGRFGSFVGRLLQANGIYSTYLDVNPDTVDVLRQLGLKVYYGDASRRDLLEAAGAREAKLLIIAVDEPEKSIQIAKTAKKYFPHLKIMARTTNWYHSFDMMELGISDFYREYQDSSLRLGADALKELGFRQYQVQKMVKLFRKKDDQMVRHLFEDRDERQVVLQKTRNFFQNIERIMQEEQNSFGKEKDFGWDTTSMRSSYKKNLKKKIEDNN